MRLKGLFICLVISSFFSTAQNNLIVFDENGENFFLFVDNKQINDSAQTEVEVSKIYDDTCRIKAIFHNKTIPEFSGKVFLLENGKNVNNRDFTYSISRQKGKTKLHFVSVNNSLSDTTVKVQSPETRIKSIFSAEAQKKDEQNELKEIYPEPKPCIKAISDTLFQEKLKALSDNHIEMVRIKDAKWFISHFCINAKQLEQLILVFDYRHSRVKIAEFAFDYMEDHRNFLDVIDAVGYDVEKEELKKFYNKRIEK
jgi:hypothetical protein